MAKKARHGFTNPRHPELEAAIVADPEVAAPYAVLGDWLQAQSDPRGELVGLHVGEKSAERAKAIQALMTKHADYFLGKLASLREDNGEPPTLEWKYGFIHRAELDRKACKGLAKILQHPSARFLVDLKLKAAMPDEVDALVAHAPRSLRSLYLDPMLEVDLTRLWPAVPELRRLTLYGTSLDFPAITLPKLERLHVHALLDIGSVGDAIANAPWPKLQVLKLGGLSCEIGKLLDRTDMPALVNLSLSNQKTLELSRLLDSPFAGQLQGLELVDCQLTDALASQLAEHRARFPRIAALDVTFNPLTDKGLAALRSAFPNVQKRDATRR